MTQKAATSLWKTCMLSKKLACSVPAAQPELAVPSARRAAPPALLSRRRPRRQQPPATQTGASQEKLPQHICGAGQGTPQAAVLQQRRKENKLFLRVSVSPRKRLLWENGIHLKIQFATERLDLKNVTSPVKKRAGNCSLGPGPVVRWSLI